LRGTSTSNRADLSTEVTALMIVLAQCPQVMSLILKVIIASPVPVGMGTVDPPIVSRSRHFLAMVHRAADAKLGRPESRQDAIHGRPKDGRLIVSAIERRKKAQQDQRALMHVNVLDQNIRTVELQVVPLYRS
jgi:hypothetical protein